MNVLLTAGLSRDLRLAHVRQAQPKGEYPSAGTRSPCAHRQSTIIKRFPFLKIEEGFSEEDVLWLPDDRETDAHMQHRMRRAMYRLFDGAAPETCE